MTTGRLAPIGDNFQWDAAAARHLLNRAGFGVPQTVIPRMVSMGARGAVEALVNYEQFTDNLVEPDFLSTTDPMESMRETMAELAPEERQKQINEFRRQQRQEIEKLKVWWLGQMRTTNRPLQEKMTLFWHGHFATSADEIKQPWLNHDINSVCRQYATGNFRSLVFAVGKTPAMLNYLDNKSNRKGKPNENWSRELMELFTMGIGSYTEQDIKEAARAFSGYTEVRGEFQFIARQHDDGEKTFLGRTGNFDGRDIINIIFEQPETARFISRKLWEYLVYESPDEELVEELAAVLRANDYELKPLLEAIFLSKEFYEHRALEGQIKSPAQYLVMLTDHLDMELPQGPLVAMAMRGLGQDLFYPPNVKGWPGNRTWINTNTLLLRYNIPAYIVLGTRPSLRQGLALDEAGPDTERPAAQRARAGSQRRTIDAMKFYTPYMGRPMNEAVDGLADRFLGRSLDDAQRTLLAQTLAGKADPAAVLDRGTYNNERAAATVHLLLSMAEYQLC